MTVPSMTQAVLHRNQQAGHCRPVCWGWMVMGLNAEPGLQAEWEAAEQAEAVASASSHICLLPCSLHSVLGGFAVYDHVGGC